MYRYMCECEYKGNSKSSKLHPDFRFVAHFV